MLVQYRTVITGEDQTIFQCRYFFFATIRCLINDTGFTIGTIRTIYTVFTVRWLDSQTIRAICTVQTDWTVFTVDHDRGTIFTIHANLAIFTVSACFT